MNEFDAVGHFHEKFGLDNVTFKGAGPRDVPVDLMEFRIRFMREELQEFEIARNAGDLPKMFDALLDLAYVVYGTAHVMGLPWTEGFEEVQRANMAKVRVDVETNSTRGSKYDVVKPPGWTAPNLEEVLIRNGWTMFELGGYTEVSRPEHRETLCTEPLCPALRVVGSPYCRGHQR